MNLHDMLMTLLQRADVQLAAVEKIPTRRQRAVVRTRKPKKVQDLKKDEKLEVRLFCFTSNNFQLNELQFDFP